MLLFNLILASLLSINTGGSAFSIQSLQIDIANDEDWFVNLPSSPLILSVISRGQNLAITNRAKEKIIQYKLGCITKDKYGVRVVHFHKSHVVDLQTNDFVGLPVDKIVEMVRHCKKKQARLAVVEAIFADGSIWKARK
jgi:hypothetical protein